MEKLTFNSMQAIYLLDTEYRKLKGENYVSEYSCRWHLTARYSSTTESYEFTLYRSDVKINGEKVEKLMDRIVLEIGSSLYPVRFEVSAQMQILRIINYDEIVDRWRVTTEKCRNEHPGDVIERYIRHSSEGISDERALLLSLYKDSFINLYFRNLYMLPEEDERERVEWQNFPLREMKSTYYCTIEKPEENRRRLNGPLMVILPGQKGSADIDFIYGPCGELEDITGEFSATKDGNRYIKRVHIRLQDKEKNRYRHELEILR